MRIGQPRFRAVLLLTALPFLAGYAVVAQGQQADLSRYVDPRIGSYPPGFTNPGPVLPFGMVAVGPDTEGPLSYGGYYQHNALITGFSHVHMSAGVFKGGQLPVLPFTGELAPAEPATLDPGSYGYPGTVPPYASPYERATEVAEAGYYSALLTRYGVQAELTATERVGLHRYSFQNPLLPARLLLDASRTGNGYRAAAVTLRADGTLTGKVRNNDAGGFDIYFAARANAPFTAHSFAGSALVAGQPVTGNNLGVILDFPGGQREILFKLALSYTDEQGAINNLNAELSGWDFDSTRASARQKWDDALSRIEVTGGTDAEKTSFYTALYRVLHFPNLHSDVDGRYRGPDDGIRSDTRPHYSQYSSWDSYRGQNAVQAEIFPEIYGDMVRSLLAFHQQAGYLPRWQQGPKDASHMSGDPIVPFIGEAWCRGQLDTGLRAQLWPALLNLPARRPADLAQRGYLSVPRPGNFVEQVEGGSGRAGTTLEYGIADFSLALMAQSQAPTETESIAQRSLNYRNLLDSETKWIRPRHEDGSWLTPFAPELGYGFQEGTSWQYSWLVMHDLAELFRRMGGDSAVDQRLDTFFNFPASQVPLAWPTLQNQITVFGIAYYGNQYAPGNEHDLQAPYLYNYSGAPWKSQAVARAAASIYTPTTNGLPGNDDLGALSGWLLWTMMGLYPMNPGTPLAVVGSPVFEKVTLKRPDGDLVIEAPGASTLNKYVQSVSLDNVSSGRSWVLLPRQAATVRIEMGPAPNLGWGAAQSMRPPSLSTHALPAFGCSVAPLSSDGDADGISDAIDQCADTPVGQSVNAHGCPANAAPPPTTGSLLPAIITDTAGALTQQCSTTPLPPGVCAALVDGVDQVTSQVEDLSSALIPPPRQPGQAYAGVASKDASWHLGASSGQFAASGAGIARDGGFDPYGHSTRKVGADIVGTRINTRALVVEGANGQRVAVVANDLYLPNDLLQRRTAQKLVEHDLLVRAGAKQGPIVGIDGENLAMTSSHSHASPFYSTPSWGTWIFQDVFDLRFYEYMATQQSEAIIAAVAGMKPVRMGGITVHSNDVTSHTYGPKGSLNDTRDGTPAGQPYEYTTQQITVVRFDDISGAQPQPLANWVIFGVHPEWVWGEEVVNGDISQGVMRMLDRETGAMTVMSQRETGSSGPHKDTRVHPPEARREFQESAMSGVDRGARILTDTLKTALQRLQNNDPEIPSQFASFRSQFDVSYASQRFAPPATRPYPGISNCNSDRVFEGDVGIPILGFPDCFYDHTEFTDEVTEPFLAALPYSPTQLRDQLLAAGVPVPTSYSATSLTAVEETAAVHLQVFKLGSVLAAMSPSEQFTSGALNLVSRLDKVPDNLWHGFDWACRLPPGHPVRAGELPAVTGHCARQNAAFPDNGRGIPGSVDNLNNMAKVRAQIHNDATGWELDPVYMFNQQDPTPLFMLGAESEPLDPAQIKGNFTHEEFTGNGYDLVVAVGMVNDYWGYMPEYRDYRSFDHYRKALNGLGPHGADFLNTRLARMAAQLNGSSVALPTNPLDPVFQAESARAELLALTLGNLARAYTTVYEAQLPAEGGTPRILNEPAPSVPRFSAATLKFVGGSNYTDMPSVRVERLISGDAETGAWEVYGTQAGEVQLQLRFLPSLLSQSEELPLAGEGVGLIIPDPAAMVMWRAGQFEWEWTASFETFVSELGNLGNRPGITPTGTYRFVVDGKHRGATAVTEYHMQSAPFQVVPWAGITVDDLQLESNGRVSFGIGPVNAFSNFKSGAGTTSITRSPAYVVGPVDYPDSYAGGLGWIRNERQLFEYGPGRDDDQQYCSRCTFRPWADAAQVTSASVTVRRVDGSLYQLPAELQAGRWRTSAIGPGESAWVASGGIVDQYGEINGAASAQVTRPAPPVDTTPDAFGFTSVSGVGQSVTVSSNVVAISGIDAPSPISIAVGEYRINGGGWTSASGQIVNGQTVQVKHTSANTPGTTVESVLNIGGVEGKFRSTTAGTAGNDTDPDAFSFGTKTNEAPSTEVVSDAITLSGYDAPAPVTAGSGTQYSLGCSQDNWTSAPGTLNVNQSICVRHTTASGSNALRKTSLKVGTVVGYFTTRTAP